MDVFYTERVEATREYTLDIDVEDYKEYLDGDEPTEENFRDYVEDLISYGEYDSLDENEHTIESGVDFNNFEFIKEELEELKKE